MPGKPLGPWASSAHLQIVAISSGFRLMSFFMGKSPVMGQGGILLELTNSRMSSAQLVASSNVRASFTFLELLWNEKMPKKLFFGNALYTFIRSLLYHLGCGGGLFSQLGAGSQATWPPFQFWSTVAAHPDWNWNGNLWLPGSSGRTDGFAGHDPRQSCHFGFGRAIDPFWGTGRATAAIRWWDPVFSGVNPGSVYCQVIQRDLAGLTQGDIFLTLEPDMAGRVFAPAKASQTRPESGIYLQGAIRHMWGANPVFGIEAWYVQEGQGKEWEEAIREKKVLAEILVVPSGKARLKGLITDE